MQEEEKEEAEREIQQGDAHYVHVVRTKAHLSLTKKVLQKQPLPLLHAAAAVRV